MQRREFVILALSSGLGVMIGQNIKADSYLRPPKSAGNFISLCIKCGQCLQVCPYHCINLLDINAGLGASSAFIDPKHRGCYLCDLLPCVLACPSGALAHDERNSVAMGVAFLTKPNACLAQKTLTIKDIKPLLDKKAHNQREAKLKERISSLVFKPCNLCAALCPVGESAISIAGFLPRIQKGCVGCGVCMEVCPAKIIEIIPHKSYDEIYKEQA